MKWQFIDKIIDSFMSYKRFPALAAQFAASLAKGIRSYLNLICHTSEHLLFLTPVSQSSITLGGWRFSKCCLPILLTLLPQSIFAASILSTYCIHTYTAFHLSHEVNIRLTTNMYYRAFLLSSPGNFIDQHIAGK